ncbi:hypothetical protein EJ03DRAFT_353952 [Teratosphaeria nubilosa]|uniref:Uncharacterized protein n=1 Tax=Teratosphaeria nubilosa TaxID=161662 RepID=A0A6G1L0S8_9PEZI|nr:hypothetical protein EJ03DRAFT_353952 [Teratosphaeria nubilosa]
MFPSSKNKTFFTLDWPRPPITQQAGRLQYPPFSPQDATMNGTESSFAATHPTGSSRLAQNVAWLYIIIAASFFYVATEIGLRLLQDLLTKTRRRIIAFLTPMVGLVNLALFPISVHYLTHYGIVLNVPGLLRIQLWPRLAPPNCQAATEVLGESSMCEVDEFYAWLGLASQPGGLSEMMSDVAVRRIVFCVGALLFCCFCGWMNMLDWDRAVRTGRIDQYVRWRRRGMWERDEDEREGGNKCMQVWGGIEESSSESV